MLSIGQIVRPRGLVGELKVRILCNDFDDFCECLDTAQIYIWRKETGPTSADPAQLVRIEEARLHQGYALIRMNGVNTIEEAEPFRSWQIGLRKADLPQPDEDTFYTFELEGLAVEDAEGRVIGTVDEIIENPAHDQLHIRPADPDLKPFLLPLIGIFVTHVDIEAGRIQVNIPPGLIESQQ